ncbi:hypothetical protein TRIP_B250324 [uncultured Desulfatiglans sp.]|nr:hypothetical protein TRIP_B250324 [uncultured Desulfatiglans sp.]
MPAPPHRKPDCRGGDARFHPLVLRMKPSLAQSNIYAKQSTGRCLPPEPVFPAVKGPAGGLWRRGLC